MVKYAECKTRFTDCPAIPSFCGERLGKPHAVVVRLPADTKNRQKLPERFPWPANLKSVRVSDFSDLFVPQAAASMTSPSSITAVVSSEDDMRRLGERVAAHLQLGQVLALSGELGAGKTRFTQGLARGLGVPVEEVTSPTFTLIQEYAGRVPVRHCDAYRLRHPDEFADLGLDELFARDGVAIIEWADRVSDDLPRDRLEIRIEVTGETERRVVFTARGKASQQLLDAVFPPSD